MVGGFASVDTSGDVNIEIVLDTTDLANTLVQYTLAGANGSSASVSSTLSAEDINFVGINRDIAVGAPAASISSFSLTATTAVPELEPATLMGLMGIGEKTRRTK